jgi:hypothetical protein
MNLSPERSEKPTDAEGTWTPGFNSTENPGAPAPCLPQSQVVSLIQPTPQLEAQD